MKLSQRAYAKHLGVSEGAVRKAIKSGRISIDKNNLIDPELADRQWQENTDPSKQRIKNEDLNIGSLNNNQEAHKRLESTNSSANSDNKNITTQTYQKSRAVKETYEAKLRKLEYEIKSRKFIPADEVKVKAFNLGRAVRDRLLNVPNQVAPMLVNQSDIFAVKKILSDHIAKALEELSNPNYKF